MRKILLFTRWGICLGCLLGSVIIFLLHLADKREPFLEVQQTFLSKGMQLDQHQIQHPEGSLYYIETGAKDCPTLLLIHGSPGDWMAWKKVMLETTLLERFRVIAIDRPPYKKSTFKAYTLGDQSNALDFLINQKCNPCAIMGHSYGSALALQLAVDFPERVTHVVSLAGTIAANHQAPKWYNHLANIGWVNRILPSSLKISNEEMMHLATDLRGLFPQLSELKTLVFLFQGGKDFLVHPYSPFYLLPVLSNNTINFNSHRDHFMIWTDLVGVEQAFDMLEQASW